MTRPENGRLVPLTGINFASLLVAVCLLTLLAGVGVEPGVAEELQPLDNGDLRNISGEEGLHEGISLESPGPTNRTPWNYSPLYSTSLQSDTPLIGDFLLTTLSLETSEYLESLTEEEAAPRYVFEYRRPSFFRPGARDPENTDLFSNNGIDMTTGPIPEGIEALRALRP